MAKFAEITVDLSEYKGNYSTSFVKDRKIPTDGEMLADYQKLRGKWRLIFVRMMLYGLRDHEAFMCQISAETAYSELFTIDCDCQGKRA